MTVTGDSSMSRRTGSLHPGELAQASVMAALCAATAIIAVVVPFAAGLSLLGTVPMGLLAYRYRLRVLITATVAGAHHRVPDRRHGRLHDRRQLRVHRRADRHRQTPRARHADRLSQLARRRCGLRRGGRRGAGRPRAAAPPDLRVDDRQHQRRSPRSSRASRTCRAWPTNSSATSPPRWTTGRTCSSRRR